MSIWHLLKIGSFYFGKVIFKGWNLIDAIIFKYHMYQDQKLESAGDDSVCNKERDWIPILGIAPLPIPSFARCFGS